MEHKIFHYKQAIHLENGEVLPEFSLDYRTWGKPKYDAQGNIKNVVWVCHALTANADVLDWWAGLFGEGCFFNPQEHFIVCANMLGSSYGSTSALSLNPQTGKPYFHDFPQFTIRDVVATLDLLREHLQIEQIDYLLGGSMGGQQALEWAVQSPDLINKLFVIATNAQHSPWGIAFNESQRMAIAQDPSWQLADPKAGLQGLRTARSIALISYRHYEVYQSTQNEAESRGLDNYKAASYQQYQGDKLIKRNFDAFAYWRLSKAMDSHDLGRGRGSLEAALAQIEAETLVVGINRDILFPPSEQAFLAKHIPQATYHLMDSPYGHDGFLIETQKITELLEKWQSYSLNLKR